MSLVSTGCLLSLQRLQPLFGLIAVAALAYQGWLVCRRPPDRRTRPMMLILWSSLVVCGSGLALWVALWLRYR